MVIMSPLVQLETNIAKYALQIFAICNLQSANLDPVLVFCFVSYQAKYMAFAQK